MNIEEKIALAQKASLEVRQFAEETNAMSNNLNQTANETNQRLQGSATGEEICRILQRTAEDIHQLVDYFERSAQNLEQFARRIAQ